MKRSLVLFNLVEAINRNHDVISMGSDFDVISAREIPIAQSFEEDRLLY